MKLLVDLTEEQEDREVKKTLAESAKGAIVAGLAALLGGLLAGQEGMAAGMNVGYV